MRKIKCGVIGLGWFGEKHCEILDGLPEAEIHALCTRTESRLKELGDRFGANRTYTDYHDLLADDEVEAVSVVTMWDQHVGPAVAALEAGKHVFLEKPMASSVEDCDRIVEAARASKGSLMVGHVCRFNPRYVAAKQEIDSGRIGRIISIYARRNLPAWVTGPILEKIGPIIGDAVHDTDMMLWLTGAGVQTAYAQTVSVRDLPNPDLGWTMYRFDSGAVGVCETAWCLPGKTPVQIDERMQVIGTEGSISIQDTAPNFAVVDGESMSFPDTTYWPTLRGVASGALREEWAYFLRCVAEGRSPDVIRPEESRAAVQACLAAEESARTGQVVSV